MLSFSISFLIPEVPLLHPASENAIHMSRMLRTKKGKGNKYQFFSQKEYVLQMVKERRVYVRKISYTPYQDVNLFC